MSNRHEATDLETLFEDAGLNLCLAVSLLGGLVSYLWLSTTLPIFFYQTFPNARYSIESLYIFAFGQNIYNILLIIGVLSGVSLAYITFQFFITVFEIVFPEISQYDFTPPQQIIYRLPSWPKAIEPQFVVGEEHESGREGSFSYTPSWNVIPQKGLVAGMLVFGAPGTAKTVAVVLQFIDQMLEYEPHNQDLKVAMFIVDRKGNLSSQIKKLASRCGRANDIVVIRLGGSKLNLLSNDLTAAALAAVLVAANSLRHSNAHADEPGWIKSGMSRILYHLIALFRRSYGEVTLKDLNDQLSGPLRADAPIDDPDTVPQALIDELKRYRQAFQIRLNRGDFADSAAAKADFDFHIQYFETQLVRMNSKNKATLLDATLDLVGLFASPELAATFCQIMPHCDYPGMSQLMHQGHIVIFEPDERMGRTASTVIALLKLEFQRAGLERIKQSNQTLNDRLWASVIDEYQTVVTVGEEVGDDVFVGLCREARITNLFVTQSLAALQARIGEIRLRTLLGAIRTKIFLTLTDPTDSKLASRIAGEDYQFIQSTTFSESNKAARLNVITDSLQGKATTVSEQANFSEQLRAAFLPIDFQSLNTFEAIACVFDGIQQRPPVKLYLKPHFLPRELPFNQYPKG